jgi:AraC-like DNA-binding protein
LEVGFAEQSHLCRVFKNLIGVSPAAWLRDHGAPPKTCVVRGDHAEEA